MFPEAIGQSFKQSGPHPLENLELLHNVCVCVLLCEHGVMCSD